MRKIIVILIIAIKGVMVYADVFDDFTDFKVKSYNTSIKSIDIDYFYKENIKQIHALSEEEQLALENMILLEKINLLEKEDSVKLLFAQNRKCDTFIDNIPYRNFSSVLLSSIADIKSRYLSFLSGRALIEESQRAKECYSIAIKKDKHNINAYIGYSLWLYFAPAISGGGVNSAINILKKAEKIAESNNQKYLVSLYLSQLYLCTNNNKKTEEYLKKAHELIDNETFSLYLKNRIGLKKPFFEQ